MRGFCCLGVPNIAVFKANLDNHAYILFAVSIFTWIPPALSTENRCVIMLYGLGRSANSLWIAE
jgi:hypothetical protein